MARRWAQPTGPVTCVSCTPRISRCRCCHCRWAPPACVPQSASSCPCPCLHLSCCQPWPWPCPCSRLLLPPLLLCGSAALQICHASPGAACGSLPAGSSKQTRCRRVICRADAACSKHAWRRLATWRPAAGWAVFCRASACKHVGSSAHHDHLQIVFASILQTDTCGIAAEQGRHEVHWGNGFEVSKKRQLVSARMSGNRLARGLRRTTQAELAATSPPPPPGR